VRNGGALRLVGIDTFSVDLVDSKDLRAHQALLGAGIQVLEGLDLSGAAPGDYELVALPLRLVGSDASPVRAALRTLP
jgi:arylformamidase